MNWNKKKKYELPKPRFKIVTRLPGSSWCISVRIVAAAGKLFFRNTTLKVSFRQTCKAAKNYTHHKQSWGWNHSCAVQLLANFQSKFSERGLTFMLEIISEKSWQTGCDEFANFRNECHVWTHRWLTGSPRVTRFFHVTRFSLRSVPGHFSISVLLDNVAKSMGRLRGHPVQRQNYKIN